MDAFFLLISLLESSPAWLISTILILGLLVGSFLNVVILRLPVMMEREWQAQCDALNADHEDVNPVQQERFNLIVPRSHCPQCKSPVRAWHNIPVIGYLLLKGHCHACGQPIPVRYPLTELVTGLVSAFLAWKFGLDWPLLFALILSWSLIVLSVIDLDHQILPDSITQPLLWLGLLISLWSVFVDLETAVIGAMAGYLSLWSIYQLFKLFTGKEGMGFGDFKLLAMLGAWMGWQAILPILLLSSLVGALTGISLILVRGHDRNIPIPYGPYLACAGWLYLTQRDLIQGLFPL